MPAQVVMMLGALLAECGDHMPPAMRPLYI